MALMPMAEWSEAKSNLDCGPEDLSSNPGSIFSVEKEFWVVLSGMLPALFI